MDFLFNNKTKMFLNIMIIQNRDERWPIRTSTVFEVLFHRTISVAVSVYSIYTFSTSKGVNVAIINLGISQSDTLLKMLRNVLIGVFLMFRIFNENEIHITIFKFIILDESLFQILMSDINYFINLFPPFSFSV